MKSSTIPMRVIARWLAVVVLALAVLAVRADTIDLMNGAKIDGKVLANDTTAKMLTIEFKLGGSLVKRTIAYSTVHAITVNGTQTILTPKAAGTAPAGGTMPVRSAAEVQALINTVGSTPPDWLATTALNYPKTLDLSWASVQGQKWNNQKNVGQFNWDIVNPNEGRWREGVKLMYHVLSLNQNNADVRARATTEIGMMYFRFFQDYARAAWWLQRAQVSMDDGQGMALAECYWRLGGRQMALDAIGRAGDLPMAAIKLLGDMGETERALKLADEYVQYGNEHLAWLLAGDACRLANRLDEAAGYYRKVVSTPLAAAQSKREQRTVNRAKENLAALDLYRQADVSKVRDGTYQDSSLGYEGQVQVSVTVRNQRIETVKVTQHREKQFYSAMRDVPQQIIAKQGVKGVDATSRATITGEAIINATAKALAKGAQ